MKRLLRLLLTYAEEAQECKIHICHTELEMSLAEDDQIYQGNYEPEETEEIPFGICTLINTMFDREEIKFSEKLQLKTYLKEHRPKWLSKKAELVSTVRFYWLPGNWKVRIKWIEKHIALN